MNHTETFPEKVSTILFILTLLTVGTAFGILIFDYFFNIFIGWSAGIYFYIGLAVASAFSICSVPFTILSLRTTENQKKFHRHLYIVPFGLVYLSFMLAVLWGSGT